MKTVKLTQREQKMIIDFVYEQLRDSIYFDYGDCLIETSFVKFEKFNFSDVPYSSRSVYSLYMYHSHFNISVEFSHDPDRKFLYFHRIMVTQ